MPTHPCLSCGACCAAYRVAMHWIEAEQRGIAEALVEKLDPHRLAMRVDDASHLRCVALQGEIGVAASCGIYPQRPQCCRDLAASWELGYPTSQCDRARVRHGLAPLTPADWEGVSRDGPPS